MASGNDKLPELADRYELFYSEGTRKLFPLLTAALLLFAIWLIFFSGTRVHGPLMATLIIWCLGMLWFTIVLSSKKPYLSIDREGVQFRTFLSMRSTAWSAPAAISIRRLRAHESPGKLALTLLPVGSHPLTIFGQPLYLMETGAFALVLGGWMFHLRLHCGEDDLGDLLAAIDRLAPKDLPRNWSLTDNKTFLVDPRHGKNPG